MPMRLDDPDTIDYLTLDKGGHAIALVLLDDFEGPDQRQRLALVQRKINRYLDFIESGEVYERLDESRGVPADRTLPVRIDIMAKHELDGDGQEFLEHVEAVAQEVNVRVTFRVVSA